MRLIDHLRNHALAQCGMFEGFFGLLREWRCRECGAEFETNPEARGHERREPGHVCDPESEE